MALSAGEGALPLLPVTGLAALMVGIHKVGDITAVHIQQMAVGTFLTSDRSAEC